MYIVCIFDLGYFQLNGVFIKTWLHCKLSTLGERTLILSPTMPLPQELMAERQYRARVDLQALDY